MPSFSRANPELLMISCREDYYPTQTFLTTNINFKIFLNYNKQFDDTYLISNTLLVKEMSVDKEHWLYEPFFTDNKEYKGYMPLQANHIWMSSVFR